MHLLVSLELYTQSFALAASVLHPRTLLRAADADPLLYVQLAPVLRDRGRHQGSLSEPLATGCFAILEQDGRVAEIFELGSACPLELQSFVHVRLGPYMV